jgi:hypothetical protein
MSVLFAALFALLLLEGFVGRLLRLSLCKKPLPPMFSSPLSFARHLVK